MFLSLLDTQPTDIWHDTAFQFIVLAFLTFIGVIITYRSFRKQGVQKEITYQILSEAPIANINKEMEDKIEIRFDNKPVKDLSLLVLKLWNSGNVAVQPTDYSEQIIFEFGERTVISAEILDAKPDNLVTTKTLNTFLTRVRVDTKSGNNLYLLSDPEDVSVSEPKPHGIIRRIQTLFNSIGRPQNLEYIKPNGIRLSPILLNPKDELTLKVLLTGLGSKVHGSGRIVNGYLIDFEEYLKTRASKFSRNTTPIAIVLMIILIVLIILYLLNRSLTIFIYIILSGCALGLILSLYNIFNLNRIKLINMKNKLFRK